MGDTAYATIKRTVALKTMATPVGTPQAVDAVNPITTDKAPNPAADQKVVLRLEQSWSAVTAGVTIRA